METGNCFECGNPKCDKTIASCRSAVDTCALSVHKIIDDSEMAVFVQQQLILDHMVSMWKGMFTNENVLLWIEKYAEKFRALWNETKNVDEIKLKLYAVWSC